MTASDWDDWPDAEIALADAWVEGGGRFHSLPYDVPDSGVRLLPGPVGKEGGAAILAVLRLSARCVPWCVTHVAPGVEVDGRQVRGVSLGRQRTIAVAVDRGIQDSLRTAHHEIWHASEYDMTPECVDAIESIVVRGRAWPGEYLSRSCERRARA